MLIIKPKDSERVRNIREIVARWEKPVTYQLPSGSCITAILEGTPADHPGSYTKITNCVEIVNKKGEVIRAIHPNKESCDASRASPPQS